MSAIFRSARLRSLLSFSFRSVQKRLNLSVTPAHFYFPIPILKSVESKNWSECRPCAGVDFRLGDQLEQLRTNVLPFAPEWAFSEAPNGNPHDFHFNNGFFEHVDAEVAYSFVRDRKPKRIIEIGGGNTTRLLSAAVRKNASEGFPAELICIEPNPSPALKSGLPGLSKLIASPVQKIGLDLFRSLGANDILFIDSSHVVATDSDVLYEYLRILPELAAGVLIHIHDIFSPLDYPKKFVMTNLCFWGEQYLLEAFLAFNEKFKVVWSSSALQQFHPDVLRKAFPAWQASFLRLPPELHIYVPSLDDTNVWPCSFWITRS